MIKWAGRLIVLYGAAHTLGALTVEGAARHAGAWFSGELWGDDLANMSPANSAYWLSVDSFGVPLILIGLTVLWLARRGITPPPFIAVDAGNLNPRRRGDPPAHALADPPAREHPAVSRSQPGPAPRKPRDQPPARRAREGPRVL